MKKITNNLKYFSVLTLVFSIAFFYSLYSSLATASFSNIWIYCSLFGISLFASGLGLGYNDSVRDSRIDLGFYYHLMTFIIVNSIGLISMFLVMGFHIHTLYYSVFSVFFWAIGLAIHYYFSSRTIKGIDKRDIFI